MTSPLKKSFAAEQLRQKKGISPGLWILLLVIVIAVVIAGYALYSRYLTVRTTAPVTEKKPSIAVLPFVNMSTDPDQVPFCDGIADAILSALTHVGNLRVIARSSSFAFRGDAVDIREVGEKLDANWVLEGSVQKAGNELRITAQLINVADLSHLISNVYERELKDVFAIQEEIAQSVVDSLKVKLLDSESVAIQKRYTENIEAYNLYLMGRHHLSKQTRDGSSKALNYFQQAIDKDPNFALAYAAIAEAYSYQKFIGYVTRTEAYLKAKQAAEKALEIDDTLAEAYTSLAWVNLQYDWDLPATERAIKRALELNPGSEQAHSSYAFYLLVMGRVEEALDELKQAQELDPLPITKYILALLLNIRLDRYDEAMENFQKGIEIDPNNFYLHHNLGRLYRKQGNYTKAIEAFQERGNTFGIGYTYAVSGEREKAEQILNENLERWKKGKNFSRIVMLYGVLGENDRALEWLEKAYEARKGPWFFIKTDYEWDPIRSDPRFKALLKKMGLPED